MTKIEQLLDISCETKESIIELEQILISQKDLSIMKVIKIINEQQIALMEIIQENK